MNIHICSSTNTTHINHSHNFVIAWTDQFDFVLISLEKTISYIFEYGSYWFSVLIMSLSSTTLVAAARKDWNFDLYLINLQFYSTYYFFFFFHSATTL